jgi:Na+/proline symporter
VLRFNNLMDYVQMLFSIFNAPLFATFLLGMFTRWATPAGALTGLICGTLAFFRALAAVSAGRTELRQRHDG